MLTHKHYLEINNTLYSMEHGIFVMFWSQTPKKSNKEMHMNMNWGIPKTLGTHNQMCRLSVSSSICDRGTNHLDINKTPYFVFCNIQTFLFNSIS